MAYLEEESSKLRRQSSKRAITLAMQGQWREAIAVNQSIIEMFPDDVDACNRLGRAYMELGEYSRAEEAYHRAAEIDPYNTIAKKNLQRLSHLGQTTTSSEIDSHALEPQQFIEEVGKAGIIQLYHLAPPATLAKIVAGERVNLRINGPELTVESRRGEYLGHIENRYSQRLIRLMEGGNQYKASVINSSENLVSVIIREVYQHPSQAGRLSFPPRGTEGVRSTVGDRGIRREIKAGEAIAGDPGYTIIGGENEDELLSDDSYDDEDNEEE